MKPSFPLGVDILEWKKAGAFYRSHRNRLSTWLTADEKNFIENKNRPQEAFAMIFAAKEAVSKALGVRALGPEALRRIRLVPSTSRTFRVAGRASLAVTVSRHRRHVVACCHSTGAPATKTLAGK